MEIARCVLAAVAVVAVAMVGAALTARPAAAQFSLGSPGGPMRLALGAGAFDFTPNDNHPDSTTQGLFSGEFHFGDLLWIVSPMVGVQVSTQGSTYLYGGFGFDINFTPNWVLTPNGAFGWYERGSGTNLGSAAEFRTGAELDYKFDDQSRLGVTVHHISNAGIGKYNPGEQQIMLVYQLPLHW
ncbi:MAG TPA: acyloxyacyl hydrolase [Stellaceae bacterium]|nr:acyloxyacyl hydrolase [Stellaceae bacterium]